MRSRSLLLISLGILVIVAAGVIASARLLMTRFSIIEGQATRGEATQLLRAFVADLRQLDVSTRDYAEWDDAEAFARSRDTAFLKANFSRDTLEGLHVNLVWLVNAQGEDVYSDEFDARTHTSVEPASSAILAQLRPRLALLRQRQPLAPSERLVSTTAGVMAVAAYEIRRSDKSAPSGMTMLFGRFIRPDLVQRVADASGLEVRLMELRDGRGSGGTLPGVVVDWLRDPRARALPPAGGGE